MEKIYVNLIIAKKKAFKDVPVGEQERVKQLLVEKGLGYLAE
ncbi:CD1375 family protein [Listeria costaricensis]|nr:CD1375 family protein [Listeria costaricensis]